MFNFSSVTRVLVADPQHEPNDESLTLTVDKNLLIDLEQLRQGDALRIRNGEPRGFVFHTPEASIQAYADSRTRKSNEYHNMSEGVATMIMSCVVSVLFVVCVVLLCREVLR